MTTYPLAFQPLRADGQLALRRQHPGGEHRFGQKQIRQKPPAMPKQLPNRGSNCRSRVQKSEERALIAAQNVPTGRARSSFHPLSLNDDRVFQQYSSGVRFTVQTFFDEPCFNFRARPWCFAEKRKAGLHARIELKTTDRDAMAHLSPTMPRDQFCNDVL